MISVSDKEWLAEHGLDLSRQYPGKWVAVRDGAVIASGDTMADANARAERLRPQRDYILEQIDVNSDLPHVD